MKNVFRSLSLLFFLVTALFTTGCAIKLVPPRIEVTADSRYVVTQQQPQYQQPQQQAGQACQNWKMSDGSVRCIIPPAQHQVHQQPQTFNCRSGGTGTAEQCRQRDANQPQQHVPTNWNTAPARSTPYCPNGAPVILSNPPQCQW